MYSFRNDFLDDNYGYRSDMHSTSTTRTCDDLIIYPGESKNERIEHIPVNSSDIKSSSVGSGMTNMFISPVIVISYDHHKKVVDFMKQNKVKEYIKNYRISTSANYKEQDEIIVCSFTYSFDPVKYPITATMEPDDSNTDNIVVEYKYPNSNMKYKLYISKKSWKQCLCDVSGEDKTS